MTSEMRPHGQDPNWSEAFWSRVAASESDRTPNDSDDGFIGEGTDPAMAEVWGASSSLSFEQFELLSAYLDDEVTPDERQQVETWLATDSKVQAVFQNLGGLSRSIAQVPVPPSASVEQTVQAVMAKIDRRRHRFQWISGSAIAAVVTAVLASVSTGWQEPGWQLASNRSTPEQSVALSSQSPTATPGGSVIAEKAPVKSVVERALIIE